MNLFEEENNHPCCLTQQSLRVLCCCEVVIVVILFLLDHELGLELLTILGVLLGVLLTLFIAYNWDYAVWKVLLTVGVLFAALSPAFREFGEVLWMLGLILMLCASLPTILSAPLYCFQRKMLALRMKAENTPSPRLFRFLDTCFCVVFAILAVCSFIGYIMLILFIARVSEERSYKYGYVYLQFTEKVFALVVGTLCFLSIFYPIALFFWVHREKQRQQREASTVEKDKSNSSDGINIIEVNAGFEKEIADGLEMTQDPLSVV